MYFDILSSFLLEFFSSVFAIFNCYLDFQYFRKRKTNLRISDFISGPILFPWPISFSFRPNPSWLLLSFLSAGPFRFGRLPFFFLERGRASLSFIFLHVPFHVAPARFTPWPTSFYLSVEAHHPWLFLLPHRQVDPPPALPSSSSRSWTPVFECNT